jgi:hypothetical protein
MAAFQAAPQDPYLRYDAAIFADECLAPDFGGTGCGGWRAEDAVPWLSASAALLPIEGREPEAPRLRYEFTGLATLDEGLTYRQARGRPDR